ncbi:unnamed protein product, partial [marine sediment metagenome]
KTVKGDDPASIIHALLAQPSCFGIVRWVDAAHGFGLVQDGEAGLAHDARLPRYTSTPEAVEDGTQETAPAAV